MGIGIIDFLIVAVIALVTWCVASEGAVGAGTTFLSVLLAGLLAMNFFEPLADLIDEPAFIGERADMIALLGLFAALLTLARLAAERLQPTFISMHGLAYDVGRWGFGFLTAYAVAGILLTALHTAPLPREFWGFSPERANMLFDAAGPDRHWLGFVQYVTEKPLGRTQRVMDESPAVGEVVVKRVFDGRTAYHWGLHAAGAPIVEEEARKGATSGAVTDQERAAAAARMIIPSFVIRYADRREQFAGGGGPAPAAPAAPSTARPSGGPVF